MKAAEGTNHLMTSLLSALRFAAQKHSSQRRKDVVASPYINHPIAVAEVLNRVGAIEDPSMLQAAFLHDTIEDTGTTAAELQEHFGTEVSSLVQELTDDKSLPQQQRKRMQVEHAPHLSLKARQIKLADKICNVCDVTPTDPAGWSLERKREYLDWAEEVVAGLRGSNAPLEKYFDDVLKKGREALR